MLFYTRSSGLVYRLQDSPAKWSDMKGLRLVHQSLGYQTTQIYIKYRDRHTGLGTLILRATWRAFPQKRQNSIPQPSPWDKALPAILFVQNCSGAGPGSYSHLKVLRGEAAPL